MSASFLESIDRAPDDSILILPILFSEDPRPLKINLGIGSYQTANGRPYVLQAVKKAEQLILEQHLDKEYQPIEGNRVYIEESLKLIFGEKLEREKVFACQTIGGTGALNLAANFLSQEVSRHLYLPNPTWPNHAPLFSAAGLKVLHYPYYDVRTHSIDFAAMRAFIKTLPPGSSIVLHSCCHNPTGADLYFKEWQELSKALLSQQVFPIFDNAYQGFGVGVEEDAMPIRLFLAEGHEMLVCSSYSKNFGLYGERAGLFAVVAHKKETVNKCASHIKQIVRTIYSSPPLHAGRLIATILADPFLKKEWLKDISSMRMRINAMREQLAMGLENKGCREDFSHLRREQGFFSLIGIDPEKALRLREEKGIYLHSNGRINIAGLNPSNLDYVIESICALFN
ncbi:Aspartate aminotransferase [Chlamydiales bacterium STE3]|nr:Aspartate aminotransferase [Chlamydiales bacterium STE3]